MQLTGMIRSTLSLTLVSAALAACADAPAPTAPLSENALAVSSSRVPDGYASETDRGGAVYTLTNAVGGNAVVAFHRSADGSLTRIGNFAAGGRGIGGTTDPLVSQYSVVLSAHHDALFAVNAGSDQLSGFRVNADGSLQLASVVSSGGGRPISIAVHDNLLYVLNGADNQLAGFRITGEARLVPLPHSGRALPPNANGAAAVRFTPDGRFLVVSERVSNRLDVFPVERSGRLGDAVVSPASGSASFGFDITSRNQAIVSETQGSVSSYALASDGAATPITASISTGGNAPCWVIITSDGDFAYSTNAGSGTIAGFTVAPDGRLTAITPGAPTGDVGAGAGPIDLDQVGGRLLYTLDGGRGAISTFVIAKDGRLTRGADATVGAAASGLQGLAAY